MWWSTRASLIYLCLSSSSVALMAPPDCRPCVCSPAASPPSLFAAPLFALIVSLSGSRLLCLHLCCFVTACVFDLPFFLCESLLLSLFLSFFFLINEQFVMQFSSKKGRIQPSLRRNSGDVPSHWAIPALSYWKAGRQAGRLWRCDQVESGVNNSDYDSFMALSHRLQGWTQNYRLGYRDKNNYSCNYNV